MIRCDRHQRCFFFSLSRRAGEDAQPCQHASPNCRHDVTWGRRIFSPRRKADEWICRPGVADQGDTAGAARANRTRMERTRARRGMRGGNAKGCAPEHEAKAGSGWAIALDTTDTGPPQAKRCRPAQSSRLLSDRRSQAGTSQTGSPLEMRGFATNAKVEVEHSHPCRRGRSRAYLGPQTPRSKVRPQEAILDKNAVGGGGRAREACSS